MDFFFLGKKPRIVARSKIHGDISIGKIYGKEALFAGGVTQSGGELVSMCYKIFADLKAVKPRIRNCLVAGVGGGMMIRMLRIFFPKVKITGVEIDPKMVDVAKNYFGLQQDKESNIIIADAIEWIAKEKKQYDLIIVDLYIGPLNPSKAREKRFLKHVRNLLYKDGIVLYNSHYQKKNKEEFENFINLCKSVFTKTSIIFSYPLNRIVLLRK